VVEASSYVIVGTSSEETDRLIAIEITDNTACTGKVYARIACKSSLSLVLYVKLPGRTTAFQVCLYCTRFI